MKLLSLLAGALGLALVASASPAQAADFYDGPGYHGRYHHGYGGHPHWRRHHHRWHHHHHHGPRYGHPHGRYHGHHHHW